MAVGRALIGIKGLCCFWGIVPGSGRNAELSLWLCQVSVVWLRCWKPGWDGASRLEGRTGGWKSIWVWLCLEVCKDLSHWDKGIFGFLGNLITHIYHSSLFWAVDCGNLYCRVQGVQLNFTFCSFLQMPLSASSSFLKSSVGSASQYWSSLRCSSCFLEVFAFIAPYSTEDSA